ncbi:MAG: polysaccharide biosynthesis/export family protein [Luteolibacter sp.]
MKFLLRQMKSFLLALPLLLLAVSSPAFAQIQIGKALTIEVRGVPPEEKGRVDGQYTVADNGTINMPYIGSVRAAGLKPEALAATLESRFVSAEIYRNPTFQVVADEEGAKLDQNVVHIGGQVVRAGPVPYQRGLTLWQAIQSAGGPNPFGTMKRVTLVRDGRQREYDVTEIEAMNLKLQPNDAITIPQKLPWDAR